MIEAKFKISPLILIILITASLFLIPSVCAAQNPKVLFDETGPYGKYYTIYSVGPYGASSFAALLQKDGMEVSRLTDPPVTSEKLKGYDVLVVMAPERNYTDSEITAIKDFVKNGGGLLLLGDNWGIEDGDENYAFNGLAQSFGVSYADNLVVEDTQHYILFSDYVKVVDVKSSPVTANVSEFYYLKGTYLKNTGSSDVLASSDADSWADSYTLTEEGFSQDNRVKESGEASGPLSLVSAMDYGNGRVVFMGAVGSYVNSWIYRTNGWKLGLNSVNWLAGRPVPSEYEAAGLIPYSVAEMEYKIALMVILTLAIILGIVLAARRYGNGFSGQIKTIKNWKYNSLIVVNLLFAIGAALIFIPPNLYLFDITNPDMYDPNFAYLIISVVALSLFFIGVVLYNLLARNRMIPEYSYINMGILLFFAGLTFIFEDVFFIMDVQFYSLMSLTLLIPLIVNLWIIRNYGPNLVIEGKEFDRLKKISVKSLPYELQPHYTNSAYIGEGGFGRVFKATGKNNRDVAIKIPKSFDKRSEKTFITEVSNWIHLDHPNIVKLYDFKILPIPYIEMEFCDGRLEKGMKTREEAIYIVYEIAKGLEYAHSKNIIHGDVKLSNIMIRNGVYKISDWGLSKLKLDESVTMSGATPQYAAPEQISIEFGKADERTDIYQLGNVFYELLTGRLPFEGEISQIYNSILQTEPTLPSKINSNAEPVESIVMKCLSKRKDERYSSMTELLKELRKHMPPDETALLP
ncbi:DUF4350 domain-containing protein [Methanobacterium aggregans]|uniref:DUF4350 domain-containing protein n=1 Tax=Methanobacterium aggregans TaxID=1615586 RepID=UPI00320C748A